MKKSIVLVLVMGVLTLCGDVINTSSETHEEVEHAVTTHYLNNNICNDEIVEVVEETYVFQVTDEEYDLLLRVCMSECGGKYGESFEGKVAVVETVINRCEMYGKGVKDIVYAPKQYSTIDNGEPDATVYEAVDYALSHNTFPDDMIYFRTKHYHSFGTPYEQIGNHFFSLEEQ